MSTAGQQLPYPWVPRPSFGMKILGGESKCNICEILIGKLASPVHPVWRT